MRKRAARYEPDEEGSVEAAEHVPEEEEVEEEEWKAVAKWKKPKDTQQHLSEKCFEVESYYYYYFFYIAKERTRCANIERLKSEEQGDALL